MDNDSEVMQTWAKKMDRAPLQAPLLARNAFEFQDRVAIHAEIKDISIVHAFSSFTNFVCTSSPPCISWSRAGKATGLESIAGQAFIDSILLNGIVQPLMIACECAAEVPGHRHFQLIQLLFKCLGYVCAWQKVFHLHHIAHNNRSRWLAVWIRKDICPSRCCAPDDVFVQLIAKWTSQEYSFQIPKNMMEQMILSRTERQVYGDVDLLPPAKRALLPADAPVEVVLQARIQPLQDSIPTLCASYSSQHCLDMRHLQDKGIFAMLQKVDGDVGFFDPFRFISMFGALEPVVISAKLALAFKQIGNAIAVPHAMIALFSGLALVSGNTVDLQKVVQAEWCRRITSYTGFIVSDERFHILCSSIQAVREVKLKTVPQVQGVACIRVSILHSPLGWKHDKTLPCHWTVRQFFELFEWKHQIVDFLLLWHDDERIHNDHHLQFVASLSKRWHLYMAGRLLAVVDFGSVVGAVLNCHDGPPGRMDLTTSAAPDISPTLNFKAPQDGRASQAGSFESIVSSRAFQNVLGCFEPDNQLDNRKILFVTANPAIGFSLPHLSHQQLTKCDHVFPPAKRRLVELELESSVKWLVCRDQSPDPSCPVVGLILPKAIPSFVRILCQPCSSNVLCIGDQSFRIESVNGRLFDEFEHPPIAHGDVIHATFFGTTKVFAGGRHGSGPIVLNAGATFEARCEFAINTSGWLASDEMQYFLDLIQWIQPAFALIGPILTWDLNLLDFDETTFQEIEIPNNRTTILPVICNAHWAAVEIVRASHRTSVTILGFPNPLTVDVGFAVARLMDLTPNAMQLQRVELPPREHMCGWQLLIRWLTHANMLEQLPSGINDYLQTAIDRRHLIDEVLVSAVEDWQKAEIPEQEWVRKSEIKETSQATTPENTARWLEVSLSKYTS